MKRTTCDRENDMKHKICVVFAAGDVTSRTPLPPGCLSVAADGGFEEMKRRGLCPDYILGDFDSLGFVPDTPGVKVYPKEKDDTDTLLAAKLALEKGCDKLLLYGGLGGKREDHSFANLSTLARLSQQGVLSCAAGREQSVFAVSGDFSFLPGQRGTVSLFAFGGEAQLSLEGLKYPFEGTLSPFFPLGISNEFTEKTARVRIRRGTVLIFLREAPETILKLLEENHG